MHLSTRERILMIRLMEKLQKHPAYAKALGVEATSVANNQNMGSVPEGLADARGPLRI